MTVIVYSKPACPACLQTKNYLKKNGANYEEKNIADDPKFLEEVFSLGFRSMPVIVHDDQAWSGHDEEKLKSII